MVTKVCKTVDWIMFNAATCCVETIQIRQQNRQYLGRATSINCHCAFILASVSAKIKTYVRSLPDLRPIIRRCEIGENPYVQYICTPELSPTSTEEGPFSSIRRCPSSPIPSRRSLRTDSRSGVRAATSGRGPC